MVEDNYRNHKYRNKNILEKLPFIMLFLFSMILNMYIKMINGDDFWFKNQSQNYTWFNYIKWRYFTWTGRVSVESILYFIFRDNGHAWRIIDSVVITILAYGISKIVITNKTVKRNRVLAVNWIICFSWLLISTEVIKASMLWITGSINYLWPAAFGIFSMIPFRKAIDGKYKDKLEWRSIVYIIFSIFTALGQEQVSLVIFSFILIISIYLYVRDKKIYKLLTVQAICVLIGMLVLFLAPGNIVRDVQETNNWLPNYPSYDKLEIGFNGIQWLFNNLVNDSRILFFSLILLITIALVKKKQKNIIAICISLLGLLIYAIQIVTTLQTTLPNFLLKNLKFSNTYIKISGYASRLLFSFDLPFAVKKITVLKYILWPVIILIIAYLIIYIYDFKIKGWCMALLYMAGIASAVIMFVSPTIYASGIRTFFVLNICTIIVFISILQEVIFEFKSKYLVAIFYVFAILKYISLITIYKG